MSASFASCLLIYSFYNSKFKGIKQTAYAFILSGSAFLLIGLRSYIPDILSIVLSNTLLVLSFFLIHLGFVYFYQFDSRVVKQFHAVLILSMTLFSCFFTYIDNSVNARIIVISFIVAMQSFYIMRTLLSIRNIANLTLALAYSLFAVFFIFRGLATLFQSPLADFMKGGLLHAISVIIFELLVFATTFGFVWIVSHRVQSALSEQASHDPLTKVLNRRALEEVVNTESSKSLCNDLPMSVIMLDIDHFKCINDSYGHGRGDCVLIKVAEILMSNTRQYDSVSRIGGEEFIILLPNTLIENAKKIAENLRLKISENDYSLDVDDVIKVTASFGVTECNFKNDKWSKILERVDSGLYQAKSAGRNTVIACNSNNQDADTVSAG